jgi:hypothetical protein
VRAQERRGGREEGERTSMGNLEPIQASCPAYAAIFLMPLVWGSLTWMASLRRESMTSRSCLNISGCWSYLVEMYCLMAAERARLEDWRKGKQRILLGRGVLVLAERGITYARQQTLSL